MCITVLLRGIAIRRLHFCNWCNIFKLPRFTMNYKKRVKPKKKSSSFLFRCYLKLHIFISRLHRVRNTLKLRCTCGWLSTFLYLSKSASSSSAVMVGLLPRPLPRPPRPPLPPRPRPPLKPPRPPRPPDLKRQVSFYKCYFELPQKLTRISSFENHHFVQQLLPLLILYS